MDQEAADVIRQFVWSGFYNFDQIYEMVTEEVFDPDEVDEAWAEAQIKDELARKTNDELSWPSVTDCDRLDQAFLEMNKRGMVALHNAGNTQSDGLSDVTEIYHERGGASSSLDGYCFYHWQDVERAVDGGGVILAFGAINGPDEKGVEIGQRIVAILNTHGLESEWPGTLAKRIEIPKIKWLRRYAA